MFRVKNSEFITSAVDAGGYPGAEFPEVVLLGRSNVGKSTFINKFVNNNKLAYVSSTPGKTQVLNFFLLNKNFNLVDVPGYGYAKVSKKQREKFGEMIEAYLTERESLKFAVLLVDFKVGPTEDDVLMYDFLSYYGIPVLVIATKKDKVKKGLYHKHLSMIYQSLEGLVEENLIVYSKDDRNTLDEIYKYFGDNLDVE